MMPILQFSFNFIIFFWGGGGKKGFCTYWIKVTGRACLVDFHWMCRFAILASPFLLRVISIRIGTYFRTELPSPWLFRALEFLIPAPSWFVKNLWLLNVDASQSVGRSGEVTVALSRHVWCIAVHNMLSCFPGCHKAKTSNGQSDTWPKRSLLPLPLGHDMDL